MYFLLIGYLHRSTVQNCNTFRAHLTLVVQAAGSVRARGESCGAVDTKLEPLVVELVRECPVEKNKREEGGVKKALPLPRFSILLYMFPTVGIPSTLLRKTKQNTTAEHDSETGPGTRT